MRKRNMKEIAQGFLSGNDVDREEKDVVGTKDEVIDAEPSVVATPIIKEAAKSEKVVKDVPEQAAKTVDEKKNNKIDMETKKVGYTFYIPWSLKKRFNRVIDEMTECGEKISKKDFIVIAIEKLISEYEEKYGIK